MGKMKALAIYLEENKMSTSYDTEIDEDCICWGNWRNIIKKTQHLFGKSYIGNMFDDGEECIFTGVMHGSDDYYYVMWNIKTDKTHLLSCVGSLKDWGYTLMKEYKDTKQEEYEFTIAKVISSDFGTQQMEDSLCPKRN